MKAQDLITKTTGGYIGVTKDRFKQMNAEQQLGVLEHIYTCIERGDIDTTNDYNNKLEMTIAILEGKKIVGMTFGKLNEIVSMMKLYTKRVVEVLGDNKASKELLEVVRLLAKADKEEAEYWYVGFHLDHI